jgi:hypothetical protein
VHNQESSCGQYGKLLIKVMTDGKAADELHVMHEFDVNGIATQ